MEDNSLELIKRELDKPIKNKEENLYSAKKRENKCELRCLEYFAMYLVYYTLSITMLCILLV